jgi:quinol-cytochrome oxidoreductase complex cytochrome b subunit
LTFSPYYFLKDSYGWWFLLICLIWLVCFYPNLLGHPDNYIEANSMVTPPHIVPEWYFLPFYAILRAVPDKLGGVLAMFGSIVILGLVVYFDVNKIKGVRFNILHLLIV